MTSQQSAIQGNVIVLLVLTGIVNSPTHGQGNSGLNLRYSPEVGSKLMYQVKISVDRPDKTLNYAGRITYYVKSAENDVLQLNYSGGLGESTVQKVTTSGRHGPSLGVHHRPPMDPFSRMNSQVSGLRITSSAITMTSWGVVKSMDGDSQLPYALGNVSLLPFEPLPNPWQDAWSVDTGIRITEKDESGRSPFGPIPRPRFGPFAQEEKEKSSAGHEVSTYKLVRSDDAVAVFDKTYELNSPNSDPPFEISGTGTLTYDRKTGAFQAMEFNQVMTVNDDMISVKYPIKITYRTATDEEIAKAEAEVQAHKDLAARLRAEVLAREAERRAKAKAALTETERQDVLAALKSGVSADISATLTMLGGKTARDDTEIADAVRPLLQHHDTTIADNAKRALSNVDPKYKRACDLNRAYRSGSTLSTLGDEVTSTTPLPAGLIVAARVHSRWCAAKVLSLQDEDVVHVDVVDRPFSAKVRRADLRLAPPEVEQPHVDPMWLAKLNRQAITEVPRIWTDVTGRFTINATIVTHNDESVTLKKTDGREVVVPLDRLCEADRELIGGLAEADKLEDQNPFK